MWRMVRCLKSHGWGGLQRTAASQAMTTWRRSYLTHRVIAHDDADILALEGRAYYGGRCEAGKIGKVPGPVAVCDVRSMYPWVCASMHLPVAVQAQGEGSVPVVPGRAMPGRDCLAEVLVETAEPWYPTRTKAGVLYPVGRLRTVLAGPELALAIASGHVRQVGRWVQYHMAPALAAYASAVYQVREEMERDGLPQLAQWIKALLVALPGKLGQRDRRWVDEQRRSPWGPWAAWVQAHEELGVRRCRALAGRVQVQHTDGYSWDAVPAMAAWILSAARVRLLDGLRAVGWSHALYWDTDAIICPESRVDRLLPSGGTAEGSLGVWQVRERARSVWVHGPKHYEIGGRRVCAGLPPAACRCDTRADHYWYQQTMAQALIEHRAPLAQRRLLPFGRDEAYRLGRVGPDGRVHPFLAEDW